MAAATGVVELNSTGMKAAIEMTWVKCVYQQSCSSDLELSLREPSGRVVCIKQHQAAVVTRETLLAGRLACCRVVQLAVVLAWEALAVWLSQQVCAMAPASMTVPVRLRAA
jgi:hypothetical protein